MSESAYETREPMRMQGDGTLRYQAYWTKVAATMGDDNAAGARRSRFVNTFSEGAYETREPMRMQGVGTRRREAYWT